MAILGEIARRGVKRRNRLRVDNQRHECCRRWTPTEIQMQRVRVRGKREFPSVIVAIRDAEADVFTPVGISLGNTIIRQAAGSRAVDREQRRVNDEPYASA